MYTESWSRVITASVAPAVMISATSLLCLAYYNRLGGIVARLRAIQRERMAEQERLETVSAGAAERYAGLRHTCVLESLAEQTVRIRRRARLIRATLMCFLAAIVALILASLMNGLSILVPVATIGTVALFLCGMVLLLAGVSCAMAELRGALSPAELEMDIVSELTGDPVAGDESDGRSVRPSAA